jgi:hypothetical protein
MNAHASKAEEVAAKATGLRPDQVRAAVAEYRAAATSLEGEPEWSPLSHMSGKDWGCAMYVADGSAVCLQIENWTERGEWQSERCYIYRDTRYELYAEARGAELSDTTRQKPHAV